VAAAAGARPPLAADGWALAKALAPLAAVNALNAVAGLVGEWS